MKTTNNFDCLADALIFENVNFNFVAEASYMPGPGDESDDDEAETNGDNSSAAGDENPPLDEEVVHSPLTTQPGGKPNKL